jgi:hypothetical protein
MRIVRASWTPLEIRVTVLCVLFKNSIEERWFDKAIFPASRSLHDNYRRHSRGYSNNESEFLRFENGAFAGNQMLFSGYRASYSACLSVCQDGVALFDFDVSLHSVTVCISKSTFLPIYLSKIFAHRVCRVIVLPIVLLIHHWSHHANGPSQTATFEIIQLLRYIMAPLCNRLLTARLIH